MRSVYGKKFDKAVRVLRKRCPLPVPVSIRTRKTLKCRESGHDLYGQCIAYVSRRNRIKSFTIEIVRGLPFDTAMDTLLHEWAHAVDQIDNGADDDMHPHRKSWGEAYAKVLRAYIDEED